VATSRIVEHVGRVLNARYRLTRPLGTGASAHVYIAEDVTLRRRVAVKLLHPGLADDEAFLRRFQAEARVVAALRHPNIVRVYDWGEDQGSPFLVMELLEGGSLRSVLDRGHVVSPAQAARIGADTARALDYAHKRGLVHRDIKPANLLFDEDGQVSVADFGLARALAEATWTEPVGAMIGTARYAAPEQIGGAALDGKADVYALALVMVEAVTGKVPFAADTTIGTLMARVDRDLPVPDELGALGPAIAAAGKAHPDERSDAGSFAAALAGAARHLPVAAPLALASEVDTGEISEDPDQTELPGRSKLFDNERPETPRRARPTGPVASAEPAPPLPVAERRPLATGGPPPRPAKIRSPRRRRRLRIAIIAAVVVALAAVGAVAYSRASLPRHPVPSVINETPAVAIAALRPLHFHLRVAGQTYDERVPKGIIISQGQPPTRLLAEGSTLAVTVSLGPPLVTVPDLSGLSQQDATNRLIGAGLQVASVSKRFDTTAPKGAVLSWSGQGGQLPKGTTVDLVLSDGPPVVPVPPSLAGQSFAAAQAALGGANLKTTENDVFSNSVPKGQVISTNPSAGTSIPVGSTVTVTVSKGPDLVPVPDVSGKSVDSASQALQAVGFSVSGVTGNPLKAVTRTSPPGGAQVLRGSSVALSTS
jgi:beta-lactam-binding protein with PASTA domain/tRNA A-37 threonylcarbamoyl transferase component Bud32